MNKRIEALFICVGEDVSSKMFYRHGEVVLQAYMHQSRLAYKIRYLFNLINLPCPIAALYSLNPEILTYSTETIIILGSLVYEPVVSQLRYFFPNANIKYLYPNIVDSPASLKPDVLRKYNCQLFSWDIQDCLRYGLKYQCSCYDKELILSSNVKEEYDFCFIGLDKGRLKLLKILQRYSDIHNLRCYFHVCPNHNFFRIINRVYKKPIPYEDYLRIILNSKCVVDFVQKGQSGTTMRTMECIFLKKKLISNNLFLKQMDFYHSENIYIVENGSFEGVAEFLKTEMVSIDTEILSRYYYDSWRKAIIDSND